MIITNIYNLPQPLVDAVKSEHTYTDKRYSVTTILKGTCEAILLRRHNDEITMDVSDMVWMLFGTAVHKVLEQAKEGANQIKESMLTMPFGDYTMSGVFDMYDADTKTVTDWKTASVWKPIYGDWDDYRKQLMAYCLLLRHAGFDAENGEIVAFLKDHSQTDAERKADYPQHPVYRIGWHFTGAELEAFKQELAAKFERIAEEERMPDDGLRPCSPQERWEKPPRWAVMKGSNKRAVKLFDDRETAQAAADSLNQTDTKAKAAYWVQERRGECTKCKRYCAARDFCRFYREKVKDAEE